MIGTRDKKPVTQFKITNVGLKYFDEAPDADWELYVTANGVDIRFTELIDQMVRERLAQAK